MTPKTSSQRKADERKRKRESGLNPLEVWAHPEDHPKIKTTVAAMNAKRGIGKGKEMSKATAAMKTAQQYMRGLTYKTDAITSALGVLHTALDSGECAEPNSLVARLRGRALYLRDSGEVKSPELMEAAADAIEAAMAKEKAE